MNFNIFYNYRQSFYRRKKTLPTVAFKPEAVPYRQSNAYRVFNAIFYILTFDPFCLPSWQRISAFIILSKFIGTLTVIFTN